MKYAAVFLLVLWGCGVSRYSANTTAKYKFCDTGGNCSEFYYDSETDKKIVVELLSRTIRLRCSSSPLSPEPRMLRLPLRSRGTLNGPM